MPLSAEGAPNRFMSGEPMGGPAPVEQPPQGMGMGAPPMGGPMPQMGGAPAPQGPTPAQLQAARDHMQNEYAGLRALAEKPKLTKKDVFSAVSDMISKGVFPTAGAKQQLISEMAKLPDDEMGLRKAIGARLFAVTNMMSQVEAAHGDGGADAN